MVSPGIAGVLASTVLLLSPVSAADAPVAVDQHTPASLYARLGLGPLGLSEDVYQFAINGWTKLRATGAVSKDIVSIGDFTQSSKNQRLYVIDLAGGRLLFQTWVAHGKNSGDEFARVFSNRPLSNQSSLGFFATGQTYAGAHGLTLKLAGQEPGVNDRAEARAIVMHGADYVSAGFIARFGRLGRSFGCPAVPAELHEAIINTIKDGSCLFLYYPDQQYLERSALCRR